MKINIKLIVVAQKIILYVLWKEIMIKMKINIRLIFIAKNMYFLRQMIILYDKHYFLYSITSFKTSVLS